jgi:site-specific recombinase XerD
VNHRGERMAYHTLLHLVHHYANGQALDVNVTPHTFRRSCTTELIRGGANLYHVKELLGHETLETLKHYTRLTIVDLKKTHEKCHPRERGQG